MTKISFPFTLSRVLLISPPRPEKKSFANELTYNAEPALHPDIAIKNPAILVNEFEFAPDLGSAQALGRIGDPFALHPGFFVSKVEEHADPRADEDDDGEEGERLDQTQLASSSNGRRE